LVKDYKKHWDEQFKHHKTVIPRIMLGTAIWFFFILCHPTRRQGAVIPHDIRDKNTLQEMSRIFQKSVGKSTPYFA
jgi:hypothetical protein